MYNVPHFGRKGHKIFLSDILVETWEANLANLSEDYGKCKLLKSTSSLYLPIHILSVPPHPHPLCTSPSTSSLYLPIHILSVPPHPHPLCTYPSTSSLYLPIHILSVPPHPHPLCTSPSTSSLYLPLHILSVPPHPHPLCTSPSTSSLYLPINVSSLLLSCDSRRAIISSTALRISRTRSSLAFFTLSMFRSWHTKCNRGKM